MELHQESEILWKQCFKFTLTVDLNTGRIFETFFSQTSQYSLCIATRDLQSISLLFFLPFPHLVLDRVCIIYLKLTWGSLRSPGWPQTYTNPPAPLYLCSVGVIDMSHNNQLCFFFFNFLPFGPSPPLISVSLLPSSFSLIFCFLLLLPSSLTSHLSPPPHSFFKDLHKRDKYST